MNEGKWGLDDQPLKFDMGPPSPGRELQGDGGRKARERALFRLGASYFMAFLSTRSGTVKVGAGHNCAQPVDALRHWDEGGSLGAGLRAALATMEAEGGAGVPPCGKPFEVGGPPCNRPEGHAGVCRLVAKP